MHKKLWVVCIILGYALLTYPVAGQIVQSYMVKGVVNKYLEVNNGQNEVLLNKAKEYNKSIPKNIVTVKNPKEMDKDYLSQLKVNGTDVIGIVTVEKAGIQLPIYHGTLDDVLEKGVGHLYGTSLPVGGKGTHTVLTAHTGLATHRYFDDLTKVRKGDIIQVTTGGVTKEYRVDKYKVMSPEEAAEVVVIKDGEDEVTLITCTPYSINTHRLVVHGKSIGEVKSDVRELKVAYNTPTGWLLWVWGTLSLIGGAAIIYSLYKKLKNK